MPDPAYILPSVEQTIRDKGGRFDAEFHKRLRGTQPHFGPDVAPIFPLPIQAGGPLHGAGDNRSIRHRGAKPGDADYGLLSELW